MRALLGSLLLLLILASGCEDVRTVTLRNIARQSDTVRVVIYAEKSRDIDQGVSFYYTNPTKIEQIATFPSETETEYFKCGYDGIIQLKSKGEVLMDLEFNLAEDCRHITFETVDQNFSQKLRQDGIDFLEERKHEAEAVLAGREELKKLNWIVGTWVLKNGDEVTKEEWTFDGTGYNGVAHTHVKEEETFHEDLRIELRGADVYLVVTGAGNEEPVPFLLSEQGDSSGSFQNPAHDFPTEIFYELTKDGGLHAYISGTTEEGDARVDWDYQPAQD